MLKTILAVSAACVAFLLSAGSLWGYNIKFNNNNPNFSAYPVWSGGGTATYTDDKGHSQSVGLNARWNYGPNGTGVWVIGPIDNTNACSVSISWSSPGWGDTSVSIPQDWTKVNLYTEVQANYNPVGSNTPACTTNASVYLSDTWTNGITYWIRDNKSKLLAGPIDVAGPLAQNFTAAGIPCTNAPISATYSNHPICMTPLVFNVQNTSPNYRIMAVQDVTGPANLLGTDLVGPTMWFYWSNSVPCTDVDHYHLWASVGGGDDNVIDTSITGIGGSNANVATNGFLQLATNSSPQNQYGGAGPQPGDGAITNHPPPVVTPPVSTNMTASPLPIQAPVTNNIIWSSTNTTIAGVTPAIQSSGQAIYNAVNTAANQAHSDAAVSAGQIAGTLSNSVTQAHSDAVSGQGQSVDNANGIIAAINRASNLAHNDSGNAQAGAGAIGGVAHNDAGKIVDAIKGLGTNSGSFTLTNYALESTQNKALVTQVGISNLLARIFTNSLDTNVISGQNAKGLAAGVGGSNLLAGIAGPLLAADYDKTETYGTALGSEWTIHIGYMGGHDIDLNPFHKAWVVALAAFTRNLIGWIVAMGLMYSNINATLTAVQNVFTFRQTQTAGESFLGTNVNAVSCAIVAILITAISLLIPMYASNWFGASGLLSMVTSHPFHHSSVSGGSVGVALWMTDQFFPLAFMTWCMFVGVVYRAAMMPILWLVGTVIRFLSGL